MSCCSGSSWSRRMTESTTKAHVVLFFTRLAPALSVLPPPWHPVDWTLHPLQGEPGDRGEDGLPGKPGLRVRTLPPPHHACPSRWCVWGCV